MGCPRLISVSGAGRVFMGASAAEVFVASSTLIERYTFPAFSPDGSVYDATDLTLPSPFDVSVAAPSMGFGDVCVGGDGRFYQLIYTSDWGLIAVDADGSSAEVLHNFGTVIESVIHGRVWWHAADPDNVWVLIIDSGADLYSVNMSTGSTTHRLDVSAYSAGMTYHQAPQQYATGFVLSGFSVDHDAVLVYDVISHDWALKGVDDGLGGWVDITGYYVNDHKIEFHQPSVGQFAIDITGMDEDAVYLDMGTPSCPPLKSYFSLPVDPDDWYWAQVQNWMATLDRTRIFIDDGFNFWELTSRRRARYHVGRVVQTGGNPA